MRLTKCGCTCLTNLFVELSCVESLGDLPVRDDIEEDFIALEERAFYEVNEVRLHLLNRLVDRALVCRESGRYSCTGRC